MSKNNLRDVYRLIEAAKASAKTDQGRNRIEDMSPHTDLSSDYDAEIVVTGNWNSISRYDEELRRHVDLDDAPSRLAKALDKIPGVEIEWSDQASTCDTCSRLVSTQPSSYGWLPQHVVDEDGLCCLECLDPAQHLESLEGNPRRANTIDAIDPAEHGYSLFQGEFESGFHRGQDADPTRIAAALRKRGIERFLFQIDDKGQFDTRFSVWVHDDEKPCDEHVDTTLSRSETDGPSNSEALERGLREASLASAALSGEGVRYVKIEGDKVVEARMVSPEEFVDGIGNQKKAQA